MASSSMFRTALRRHIASLRSSRARGQTRPASSKPDPKPELKSEAKPLADDPIPAPSTVPPLPIWHRLGPLTSIAAAYGRAQSKRPYVTQVCSSLVIFLCGDISAQTIGGKEYDPTRTGRALIIGGMASLPTYHWFLFLSHNFNYASRVLSIGTKVVVNQIVFATSFNTFFFGMHSLLSGDSPAEIWARLQRTVPVSLVNSVKLWPAVTAVNMTFVPIEYRSVFAGVVAVGWQTYLSFLNRKAEEEVHRALHAAGHDVKAEA